MRRTGVTHALVDTLPGRVVVGCVLARVLVYAAGLAFLRVPAWLAIVDMLASVGLAIGAAYFAWKLAVFFRQHLLWRVRRKLVLSYVFIGYVPVVLLLAFCALGGFLFAYNLSAYLVQSRLRAVADEARFLAQRRREFGGRSADRLRSALQQLLLHVGLAQHLHCLVADARHDRKIGRAHV